MVRGQAITSKKPHVVHPHAAKEAALSDVQNIAEAVLDAESKLGEMIAARPTTSSWAGTSRPLPDAITKKRIPLCADDSDREKVYGDFLFVVISD